MPKHKCWTIELDSRNGEGGKLEIAFASTDWREAATIFNELPKPEGVHTIWLARVTHEGCVTITCRSNE